MNMAATQQRIAAQRGNSRLAPTAHWWLTSKTRGPSIDGIKQESMGGLVDLIKATTSGPGASIGRRALQFLFDAQNQPRPAT